MSPRGAAAVAAGIAKVSALGAVAGLAALAVLAVATEARAWPFPQRDMQSAGGASLHPASAPLVPVPEADDPLDRRTMVGGLAKGGRTSRCQRWLATAETLGETFAGHTLRRTIVRRHCTPIDGHGEAWDWPWGRLEGGLAPPPNLHRVFGAWSIRCGAGAARRRCALAYEAEGTTGGPGDGTGRGTANDAAAPAIATHFVIDRVAGREMLLWRVFVPLPAPSATTLAGLTDGGVGVEMVPMDVFRAESEVRFRVGGTVHRHTFPACGGSGCLMEARGEEAGAVATRLADKRPVIVRLYRSGRRERLVALPARGFAMALAELIRLRRAEADAARR